jgi:hypothetical protein
MKGIPFTAYDVFAYLSAGFFLVGAADYAFPGEWLLDADLTTAQVFAWIIVAYVMGHVSGQISSVLLEKGLVKHHLGYPTAALFGTSKASDQLRELFPGYFEEIHEQIRELVKTHAEHDADITKEDALFYYCDARVKRNEQVASVLAVFLGLYGFARNVCIAAAVSVVLLVVGAAIDRSDWELKLLLAGSAAVIAIFLLYRYLKFFRVYALEMFCAYAASYPPED